jgi:hypothetical protein
MIHTQESNGYRDSIERFQRTGAHGSVAAPAGGLAGPERVITPIHAAVRA